MNKILVTRSSIPTIEEYTNEIKDVFESRWLTNMGTKHQELEIKLQEYLDCTNVMLYVNGHIALENAIESFNFPKGSEIITTPFTFASTTHAIARTNMLPVFCDIKNDDYTIDENKIESLITEKTVAIMPVHVYGNMCNVEKIEEIAQKHNLKVIYDAAHAFGVKYSGTSSANFGDISMYSFHATKVFNTIEGGALCFKDSQKRILFNELRDFGIKNEEEVTYIGGNGKMNEFAAAMGLCNLRHLDDEILKRKKVVEQYRNRLLNVEGIKLVKPNPKTQENYAYFPVMYDGYKKDRNEVFEQLKTNNIFSRKYFYPITSNFDCYKSLASASKDNLPNANYVADRIMTLPLFADLTIEDVNRICDIILS